LVGERTVPDLHGAQRTAAQKNGSSVTGATTVDGLAVVDSGTHLQQFSPIGERTVPGLHGAKQMTRLQ
jgi:hypothetical protein